MAPPLPPRAPSPSHLAAFHLWRGSRWVSMPPTPFGVHFCIEMCVFASCLGTSILFLHPQSIHRMAAGQIWRPNIDVVDLAGLLAFVQPSRFFCLVRRTVGPVLFGLLACPLPFGKLYFSVKNWTEWNLMFRWLCFGLIILMSKLVDSIWAEAYSWAVNFGVAAHLPKLPAKWLSHSQSCPSLALSESWNINAYLYGWQPLW